MIKIDIPFNVAQGLNKMLQIPRGRNAMGIMIHNRNKVREEIEGVIIPILKKLKSKAILEAHLVAVGLSTHPQDVDNLSASIKQLLDSLKDQYIKKVLSEKRLFADDNYKIIKSLTSIPVKVNHKDDARLSLIICESKDELLTLLSEII